MKYRITHTTSYRYTDAVTLCENEAYLLLRNTPAQRVRSTRIQITPTPASKLDRTDFFGNRVSYFSVQAAHQSLQIMASSEVQITAPPAAMLTQSPPWKQVRDQLRDDTSPTGLLARSFILPSPFITTTPAIRAYAEPSFLPQRPLLEAINDLNHRIFTEFTYDPHFTTIVTPLAEVLEHRRGVCQDFAHLAIACVRAMGLPARYVSGYLETLPPPGQEKLRGADASHAWLAVYSPGLGWIDFDPTNDQIPVDQHITTAWGRDYGDVTPLKGVIFGGGEHRLAVAVDVERLGD